MTDTLYQFIQEHKDDNLDRLLLSAKHYPGIDVTFVVEQISIRRQIRDKLPAWYANKQLIFPSRIAAEQCSSEQTARYKQRLLEGERHVCDLTGGMGVDTYYFSQQVNQVSYVECIDQYFDAAIYNFSVLQADNIQCYHNDARSMINRLEAVDTFYIDPARRGTGNTRVFALSDCEPDLLMLLPTLQKKAQKVIAKFSPMLDIKHTLNLLPQTSEIHVVSIKNECKELIFILKSDMVEAPVIHCANYTSDGSEQSFCFRMSDENVSRQMIADQVESYLYEPNASVLKAGAYKQIALKKGVKKLHVSSHLYTSDRIIGDFPGRIFKITTVHLFNGKWCKTIVRQIPKANISVRNFPMTVNELRKRVRIAEGGDIYLFATTLSNNRKVIIQCEKLF